MKEYTISNEKVYQDELTVQQDQDIAELISSLELGNITDLASLKLGSIITALSSKKALTRFFHIILTDENGDYITETLAGRIKNSQMEEILKDFFSLNPKVRDLLTILKTALLSTNTISTSQDSEKNEVPNHQTLQNQP